MSSVRPMKTVVKKDESGDISSLQWSPVFDTDRAADALADFLEAAQGMLDQMQAFSDRAQTLKPWRRARRDLLRHLAAAGREVEFHELPRVPDLGGGGARSLIQKLTDEGLVESRRDETYPNMLYVRISEAGADALRKIRVEEAMDLLHGMNSGISRAVGDARGALERLVEVVEAR